MTLADRHALVTGGGTGIGAAIALALAGDGATVTITGRRDGPLREIASRSERIHWRIMDVRDEAMITGGIKAASDEHGAIDILVANAGIAETAPLHKITLEHWRDVQRINVEGVMLSMRGVVTGMAERGWGRIIAISSIAGLSGLRYCAAYSASKHAVIGLVKSVAEEVLMSGVTVNALCPGYVMTPLVERNIEKIMARSNMDHDEALAALRDTNPFGRMIEPEEVAAAVLWLCGPGSGAITAQAIPISGGQV